MSGAEDEGGLKSVWEIGLLGRNLKGIDFAGFMTAMALVKSDVRRGKKCL